MREERSIPTQESCPSRPVSLRFRSIPVLVALVAACSGAAALPATTRSWPGAPPCQTTLQTCLDGSDAGDIVEILENDPIAENLTLTRSVILRAPAPHRARFAPTFGLVGASNAALFAVRLERLAFIRAGVDLHYTGSGVGAFELHEVEVDRPEGAQYGIRLRASNPGSELSIVVESSRVAMLGLDLGAAIGVESYSFDADVELAFNEIRGLGGSSGSGLEVESLDGTLTTRIVANRVRGLYSTAGIHVAEGATEVASDVTAALADNVVIGGGDGGSGIVLTAGAATIRSRVFNNTVTRCGLGVLLLQWSGAPAPGHDSDLFDNLIAFNATAGILVNAPFWPTVRANHNLVWGSVLNSYPAGPNELAVDPLLEALAEPRLRAGSPAIDQGDSERAGKAFDNSGVRPFDRDGMRRFRGAAIDIGAFESGGAWVTQQKSSGVGTTFQLSHGALDALPGARPLLTATRNFAGEEAADVPQQLGLYYASSRWHVFTESAQLLPAGSAFVVHAPAAGVGSFVHSATVASMLSPSTSLIDEVAVNGRDELILLATQNWNAGGSPGVYNNHPIAVASLFGTWAIVNADLAAINADADFDLLAFEPSPNAWRHEASAANLWGSATRLNHPLLDSNACALLLVTPTAFGPPITHPVGVRFDQGSWSVYFTDGAAIPDGAIFHVAIDPAQAERCARIFEDDFESGSRIEWSASSG